MSDCSLITFGFVAGAVTGAFFTWLYRNRSISKGERLIRSVLHRDDFKLVMVVRTDLGMGKGKIGAQCAHAAIGCFTKTQKKNPEALEHWNSVCGQAKIVLKCASEEELLELRNRAQSAGLIASLISDAGRTQIEAGSYTVLGIGPDCTKKIDVVTGHLKLL